MDGLYSYTGTAGQATLTISAEIQKAALEAMGDRKGTIGIYNYRTGEILCAVTTPNYDPDNVPDIDCLLYTSPSPRDRSVSRMPSSA